VEEEEDEEAQEEAPKDEAEIQVGGGAPPASVSWPLSIAVFSSILVQYSI
jgi:hypothetical protein